MFDDLEAKNVFKYFYKICEVPHGSGNEKKLSDYLVEFAKKNNLYCERDKFNNVLIKKVASPGYENVNGIILQAHMDMVCVKKENSKHDFENDKLELIVDGNFLCAKDTSLGADNGIGVAIILAVLESKNILHPDIEAIFTVDEERSMLGAKNFDISKLKNKIMFNLDSDEEGYFVVGSGGGLSSEIIYDINFINSQQKSYVLKISNLLGGHSAVEIDKERANAIILMARILNELSKKIKFDLADISGGTAGNVIANCCEAVINFDEKDFDLAKKMIDELVECFKNEFGLYEKNFLVEIYECEKKYDVVLDKNNFDKLVQTIFLMPNGLINRNLNLNGIPETSSNIGLIKISNGKIVITSFARSSCESKLDFIFDKLEFLINIFGGKIKILNKLPAWDYKPDSKLIEFCKKNYGDKAKIMVTHGGLECSFFKKIKDVEIISMGPNIFNCHSVNEKLEIASVERLWKFFKKLLANMKNY